MSIGILIHNMILLLICLIFFRTVPVIAGVLIGAAAAEVLLISIARSTADGAYSSKKMVIHSLIRSLCAVILVCLLWKFTTINLLAVVLGALGLKTGAYVYPVLQKRTDRKA